MKKIRSMTIALFLALSLVMPALALDNSEQQSETAAITNLDELIAAMESVEPYGTVTIANQIDIDRNCVIGSAEYDVNIALAESFSGDAVFSIAPYAGQDIIIQGIGYYNSNIPFLTVEGKSVSADTFPKLALSGISLGSCTMKAAPLISMEAVDAHLDRVFIMSCNAENVNLIRVYNGAKITARLLGVTSSSCENASAVWNDGSINVTESYFSQNISYSNDEGDQTRGGAIYNADDGHFEADNSTFENNFAHIGGAIFSCGAVKLTECFYGGNACIDNGGGSDIYNCGGTLQLNGLAERYEYGEDLSVGFFLDNIKNRFVADDTAKYLGTYVVSDDVSLSYFGVKFVPYSVVGADYVPTLASADELAQFDEKDIFIPPVEPEPQPEPEQPETPPQPEPPAEDNPPADDNPPQGQETGKEDNQGGDNQPQKPDDNSDEESSQEPPEQPTPPQDGDTPAASEKPSRGHSRPSVRVPAPAPKLQCSVAVIDCSRSAKLSGYGDGQLHLEDSLTRAQMSKIIYGLLDENCIEKIGKSNDGFNDVPAEAWFHAAVSTLYNAGVVNGVGGGNYNPNDTGTWAQIIAVLSRFVDEEDCTLHNIAYNGWAESAIKTAVALQWIEDRSSFDANAVISRGEFVELVNHVLSLYV